MKKFFIATWPGGLVLTIYAIGGGIFIPTARSTATTFAITWSIIGVLAFIWFVYGLKNWIAK